MKKVPSFAEATVSGGRVGGKSINGKSIAEMSDSVKANWDSLELVRDGKPVNYRCTLETEEGNIVLEFFPEDAPAHVKSFLLLAKAGFYDGVLFHRCIPGFMIQGGCPLGNGTGGPSYSLKQEFNPRPHLKGVLSMARAQSPDSGGSQFFICVDKSDFLDNQYTVFGKVTSGIEVADAIVAKPGDRQSGAPKKPVKIVRAVVSEA